MDRNIRNIESLTGWNKNPRSISTKGFNRLKKQIKALGMYKPLLITDDGTVLGGNMRLRAYKELGIKDVWVSVVDAPTEEKKLEYALSDNDRAGFYDDDLLANLTGEMPDFNWEDYSVDLKEPTNLQDLLDQFKEVVEDEVPELTDNPISKLGEVYQLGKHRLMCGDSTKIEDVELLMNGQKADMVFTDPPYGVSYVQGKYTGSEPANKFEAIKNDELKGESLREFITTCFINIYAVTKDASIYVWSAPLTEGAMMLQGVQDAGFHVQSQLIWNKQRLILGRADYQWQHEICWYGYKGKHEWYGDRKQTTVWAFTRDTDYTHPTQKPVELAFKAIKNSSKGGDIVLDTFCGSGSTLIASEQSDRNCYAMELDPKYCDVIRKRYAKFIGKEDEWQML